MAADEKSDDTKQATPAGAESAPPPADALANPDAAPGQNTSPIAPEGDKKETETKPVKKVSGLKQLLKHFNLYFLLFLVVMVIGGVVVAVAYLSSQKTPPSPAVASQNLTQDELKQLANSNATVGGSGETLTIQGNAVFSGQVLVRSNLDVAGNIQLGGNLNVAQLSVSSSSDLADTQANSLQVSGAATFQGVVTIQNGLNLSGNTSINTATIGTLTASKIIMSGNAQLQIPNHISFSGSSAPRVSGAGGSSASVSGSDTSGTVTVTTGGAQSDACMANVTFNQPFLANPNVIISLESSSPINLQYYADKLSKTGFSICSANAPPAHQQVAFSYFITASSVQAQ